MGDTQKQLFRMLDLVDEAQCILENNESDLDEFGKLLDATWRLKRQTGSKVSTDIIDVLYEKSGPASRLLRCKAYALNKLRRLQAVFLNGTRPLNSKKHLKAQQRKYLKCQAQFLREDRHRKQYAIHTMLNCRIIQFYSALLK